MSDASGGSPSPEGGGDKRGMSRGAKLALIFVGALLVVGVPAVYLASGAGGESSTTPGSAPDSTESAPQTPGETEVSGTGEAGNDILVDPETPGFYGEIPEGLEIPITLTESEVAAVESGNGNEVMDQRLVPVLQVAVDAIRDNGFSAEGLNLSNILADRNTVSQVEEILSNFADQGSDQAIDICFTTPNTDGSMGFCDPDQASILELGKNAEIAGRTRSNDGPTTFSIGTAMQPTTYGNQLVLATDRIEDLASE